MKEETMDYHKGMFNFHDGALQSSEAAQQKEEYEEEE